MPVILTEKKYNQVKNALIKNKGLPLRKIAQLTLVSLGTVSYIKNSKNYEDYRQQLKTRYVPKDTQEEVKEESKKFKGFFKNLFRK